MSITPETLGQIVGVAVALSFPIVTVIALAKGNKGVDGHEWLSDALTWRRRVNPPREQVHNALRAE